MEMKNNRTKSYGFYHSLYWRIAIIFLLTLGVTVGISLYMVGYTSDMYFQEASQKLNRTIASHIAKHSSPLIRGEINHTKLEDLFHDVMVVNPSLEVYLLDTEGKILSYNAPAEKIQMDRIDLEPVHRFIADTSEQFLAGNDPRHPGINKVFSAAKLKEEGRLTGYIYVVLASEEYDSVMERLTGSYMLRVSGKTLAITTVIALIVGLLMLWLLTNNLNKIIKGVQCYQKGDLDARIELRSKGELTQLAYQFNEMADTIAQYINEIKSVETLRRELIANISHDLRTPLASIQGYAETLVMKKNTLCENDRQKYTEVILKSSEHILKLVEDLFQLSKLEARQIEAHFEYFSLQELLSDVSQKYQLFTQQKQIELTVKIPKNLPMVYADIALIDRVLQNLIDNALKFTKEGGNIVVELIPQKARCEVWVTDSGIGIKEEELPCVFERYQHTDSRKDSVGLGLAIVKKILELHQSDISVESRAGHGTTFRFDLSTIVI